MSLILHDPKWQFRQKVTPPPGDPHFAPGSGLPSCAVRMGFGRKILVAEGWRVVVVLKVILCKGISVMSGLLSLKKHHLGVDFIFTIFNPFN